MILGTLGSERVKNYSGSFGSAIRKISILQFSMGVSGLNHLLGLHIQASVNSNLDLNTFNNFGHFEEPLVQYPLEFPTFTYHTEF